MTGRPAWLDHVAAVVEDAPPSYFARFAPPDRVRRRSAVLMLFGPRSYAMPSGAGAVPGSAPVPGDLSAVDVVLTERSSTLRSHAGQVSFPGGALDPGDDGPVAAALRESREEVGIDPASVEVVATLPSLFLSPSANSVVPVLAWWPRPGPVAVVDPGEVARVARVPVQALVDPANRFTVESPRGGWVGPAFEVDGLFVWGFTAMLLDVLLETAEVAEPWDRALRRPIPAGLARAEPTPPGDPEGVASTSHTGGASPSRRGESGR